MFTTAQVAAGFGVSTGAVRQWIQKGWIVPTEKANVRGDHRFSREVVQGFASEHGLTFREPALQPSIDSN